MNWKAVPEDDVRILAKDRFGSVLINNISFEALCEEMTAYDRMQTCKKLIPLSDIKIVTGNPIKVYVKINKDLYNEQEGRQ